VVEWHTVAKLKMLLKLFGKELLAVFEARCRADTLNALKDQEAAAASMAELRMKEHLDGLRARLGWRRDWSANLNFSGGVQATQRAVRPWLLRSAGAGSIRP
jgi:hypothetical protein